MESIAPCVLWTSNTATRQLGVRRIAGWSLRRVALAAVLWILGAPVLAGIGLILGGLTLAAISGGQRVALSANLNGWATGFWLLGPPIALIAGWLMARRDLGALPEPRFDELDTVSDRGSDLHPVQ